MHAQPPMCAQDAFASPLTFSGGTSDTMALGLLEAVFQSPRGQLVGSLEQALPLRPAWLNFNRARLRLERALPIGSGVSAHACLRGAPGSTRLRAKMSSEKVRLCWEACLADAGGGARTGNWLPRLVAGCTLV